MTSTTWFITGAGRGIGRAVATAALERGDRVAATARDPRTLEDLVAGFGKRVLPLTLDVTDRTGVTDAVRTAAEHFGAIDVVFNNAGYGQFGAVEELSESDIRDQLETNVLGALWMSQAAVPIMRRQGGGRILQMSTLGGLGAFANLGAYNASKWALEALSESLAQEVASFGVRVTILEPGGFSTDWAGSSARHTQPMPEYEPLREAAAARRAGQVSADPSSIGPAVLAIADADEPPLRIVLGAEPLAIARGILQRRIAEWDAWAHVGGTAQG